MFTMTTVLALTVLSFSFLSCSQQLNETIEYGHNDWVPRIVRGRPASLGDVPYQVAFKLKRHGRKRNTYVTFCGGTIIGPSKLISAAHCFVPGGSQCCGTRRTANTNAYAVAGNLYNEYQYKLVETDSSGQWRQLEKIAYPRRYRFPRADIAVVFTKKPFEYNSRVGPIPYATKFINYQSSCLVSGYGRKSRTQRSEMLQLADMDILSLKFCSRMHRRDMRKFICTSNKVSDIAKGDSGGPLVCKKTGDPAENDKGVLVGVVSGNRARAGSFFTRVSAYSNFIQRGGCCRAKCNDLLITTFHIFFLINARLLLF